MRLNTIIMLGLAVIFGGLAMVAGRTWLAHQQAGLQRPQPVAAPEPVAAATVVVAAVPLRYGDELTGKNLREVRWPAEATPAGAFKTIAELTAPDARRVALAPMDPNEPILPTKITGPGGRGTLSAVIEDGMKAVTVRVNDVLGVGGFVLPGERVDILLTRNLEKEEAFSDVILQNVKVLAIDQSADERAAKAAVVKAVTLEVGTAEAQKLTLAATIGSLSLALRSAGAIRPESTQRVSIEDLARVKPRPQPVVAAAPVKVEPPRTTTTVTVTRALKSEEYSVPIHRGTAARPTGTASAGLAPRP
ncbi:MAG: Flp pilus assembly protein RcpC/CpaB [uncultured Microvirga sp.]|uniref:Flp pilus assembly protein RcpC/CpaB n=1 Tax=uncultured Microvirga sp. TaxID=412392 RepID=A0A6J4MQ69_9HYPH|nr:MAG: Flp pilus assembly protein RcpC/CpaB [uncultured Microvirga sp.]